MTDRQVIAWQDKVKLDVILTNDQCDPIWVVALQSGTRQERSE